MSALSSYLSAVRMGESGVEDFVKLAGLGVMLKGGLSSRTDQGRPIDCFALVVPGVWKAER